jgi:hypothetical protein
MADGLPCRHQATDGRVAPTGRGRLCLEKAAEMVGLAVCTGPFRHGDAASHPMPWGQLHLT